MAIYVLLDFPQNKNNNYGEAMSCAAYGAGKNTNISLTVNKQNEINICDPFVFSISARDGWILRTSCAHETIFASVRLFLADVRLSLRQHRIYAVSRLICVVNMHVKWMEL